MTQLAIRNRSSESDDALKQLAAERVWSINQAANYLLMKGASFLDEYQSTEIGTALDGLSWSCPSK